MKFVEPMKPRMIILDKNHPLWVLRRTLKYTFMV